MKKKISCLIFLTVIALVFTGCDVGFGEKHVDDPEKYGEWESYLEIPSFLPSSIDDCQVNAYSYTLLAYMDICYEIFLDISVTEKQFEKLIYEAKQSPRYIGERAAAYCEGYFEIVFQDYYEISDFDSDTAKNVSWADIEKIVYNPKTLNIVYVCFHANDTGVYETASVAYFNRFSINEKDYVQILKSKLEK